MIYTILTRKPFKFICTLAILILAVIILVWMVRTPTIIDMHYVSTLSKKYPIIFLSDMGSAVIVLPMYVYPIQQELRKKELIKCKNMGMYLIKYSLHM